jgi:hypothetical protein
MIALMDGKIFSSVEEVQEHFTKERTGVVVID